MGALGVRPLTLQCLRSPPVLLRHHQMWFICKCCRARLPCRCSAVGRCAAAYWCFIAAAENIARGWLGCSSGASRRQKLHNQFATPPKGCPLRVE
jgi:hypothetical protein